MSTPPDQRLHVPLPVHDALRRGQPVEAMQALRDANPGLDARAARDALGHLARHSAATFGDDDRYARSDAAAPVGDATLPSAVAAKIATGNTVDAARRLRETRPGLSEAEAEDAVRRHASPLLQQARTETVVHGDSGRYGWVGWVAALLVVAVGFGLWRLA
ncbi:MULTISPECIES: hypothetical protein [Luteimonas]|uniref:hypothetical protein n=1 Tax=Luteimonas TaxID=83614 RepID=UPI000C7E5340|nr:MULTISPECIES: hypothetical protein [Luteimonas]